ncbi:small conductance mechanosensitive channel [Geosporobacter subterraneus DSM 17957]|uniref:Small conductance mechanosensitive channel n=1 Tax=Geosporobacter subterraneus DSM 17957 TaxID=1121919 RepID=A0A1M6FXC9_9FIRM|nr:mechanosensitive ion channel family protein [Geosporobacter subterraneus]SHJ02337.1 small conductance mechanosensitive channel [Geosporobacter subterraneus DSM 17957]
MDLRIIEKFNFVDNIKPFATSLIILIISFFLIRLVMFLTGKVIEITKFNEQREQTIKSVIDSLFSYFILTFAVLNILSEFGLIRKTTVLTGAGIITLVAGLGAQNLIKDIINGFFILFERQMKVGDFVSINEQYLGTVEEIGLRATAIREWSMKKVYIPNGEIKTLKNYFKERARVILEVVVPFEEDQELVEKTLKEVCSYINETYADKLYHIGNISYAEFSLYGIMSLDGKAGGAKYIITGVVNPHAQWLLRNRAYEHILRVFREKNIRIAYPTVEIRQKPSVDEFLPHDLQEEIKMDDLRKE